MYGLILFCRAGFESECAADIQARAGALGVDGFCKAKPQAGYVSFHPHTRTELERLMELIDFRSLTFARQWFAALQLCKDLPVGDRVAPLATALDAMPAAAREVFLETPDTNAAKALSRLIRGLRAPLLARLREAGRLQADAPLAIHIMLLNGTAAMVGYAPVANSAPWPGGIPRLRQPAGAPSRSTLKLDEALLHLLDPGERERLLRTGMQAVDLGAAPGGWTWQLVRRGLHVTAVDNGPMDDALMASGLVEHRREDGFRYQPPRPVDWMVCDMVESPMRVTELVARWFEQGWCRACVFNLKLPMKKRYQETRRCLDHLEARLREGGLRHRLACKQLYHDREEVTVCLWLRT